MSTVLAADTYIGAGLPPLPSEINLNPPPDTPTPAVPRYSNPIRTPRIGMNRPVQVLPGGYHPPTNGAFGRFPGYPPKGYQSSLPASLSDEVISWDAISKEYTAKPGEAAANFNFALTNVSKTNVVVQWVRPSCGCTVAKLPPTPWTLKPGESGNIGLTVDLRGKFGTLSKYVAVQTSGGQKTLVLKITVPPGAAMASGPGMDRSRNMQMAMVDRQAVFRGDCARCHATPTIGKTGHDLYASACAICHDSPHRATMVPDLRALKVPTGKEFWTQWITNGKPGSLMPAFARTQGGPLTEPQIESLAQFLDQTFPKNPTASASAAAHGSPSAVPALPAAVLPSRTESSSFKN